MDNPIENHADPDLPMQGNSIVFPNPGNIMLNRGCGYSRMSSLSTATQIKAFNNLEELDPWATSSVTE